MRATFGAVGLAVAGMVIGALLMSMESTYTFGAALACVAFIGLMLFIFLSL